METGRILFLNEREVKKLLTTQKVLDLVEISLADFAKGDSVNPVKLHLPMYPDYDGYINSMPSYIRNIDVAGVKLVSVHKSNPENMDYRQPWEQLSFIILKQVCLFRLWMVLILPQCVQVLL